MHAWDWLFADRWVPALGFGFATLTAYPNDNPETTSFDGYCGSDHVGLGWDEIHDNTTCDTKDDTSTIAQVVCGYTAGNGFYHIYRWFSLFDTSAIGPSIITDATYSIYYTDNGTGSGAFKLGVFATTPASNTGLSVADFDQIGTTNFITPYTFSSISVGSYTDKTMNASGLAAISSSGVTKLGMRETEFDAADVDPFGSNYQECTFQTADYTGTSRDPKLTVTYTVVSPSSSYSPSASVSPSISPSASLSPSASASLSPSSSLSPSASISPSSSLSPSLSPSSSISPSSSRSPSSSISASISPSSSVSASVSPSSSRSPSASVSPSASASPSLPSGYLLGNNNNTGIKMGVRKVRR